MKLTRLDCLFIGMLLFSSATLRAAELANPDAEQKIAIDRMHHQLHDDMAAHKAKEAQALKELNEMTIREDVKLEDINAKIDELMSAKTHIMQLSYAHLVEMRAILTDEQKVGYDKAVLGRAEVK